MFHSMNDITIGLNYLSNLKLTILVIISRKVLQNRPVQDNCCHVGDLNGWINNLTWVKPEIYLNKGGPVNRVIHFGHFYDPLRSLWKRDGYT